MATIKMAEAVQGQLVLEHIFIKSLMSGLTRLGTSTEALLLYRFRRVY